MRASGFREGRGGYGGLEVVDYSANSVFEEENVEVDN
jgi:hypothetical protein